ncbi:MAG TPA: FISUMP domain-containing protein [Bacteroidales bacterium]|nr:FISUMP domain-containing protein [Bacteroidales bacterium]HSA43035.1 FISUMP domain-containing protein [Bacteroidales bacterium]
MKSGKQYQATVPVILFLLLTNIFSLPVVQSGTFRLRDTGTSEIQSWPDTLPFSSPPASGPVLLFDNGPLVNSIGTGFNGADQSVVQTSAGMSTLGFSHSVSSGIRISEEFVVPENENWTVTSLKFFAYQTGSSTTSTITHLSLRIRKGGYIQVFGNTSDNYMTSTTFSGVYRVTETDMGNTQRPIMEIVCDIPTLELGPGIYYLDWQTAGSLSSGPWIPSVTVPGIITTGNATQINISTNQSTALVDGGTQTPQGIPFQVYGYETADTDPYSLVRLQVDMSGQQVAPEGVFVAFNNQGWNPVANPLQYSGFGIYETTVVLSPGDSVEYRFINGSDWEELQSGCSGSSSGNRILAVPQGDTLLPLVCYGECAPCAGTGAVINGMVTYFNSSQSPLGFVNVNLVDQNGQSMAQSYSMTDGSFSFTNVPAGNYSVIASSFALPEGINNVDALFAHRHSLGLDTLTGLTFLAGDVNEDDMVDSMDVVRIQERILGKILEFSAGTWIFDTVSLIVTSPAVYPLAMTGLCIGDIDRNANPGPACPPLTASAGNDLLNISGVNVQLQAVAPGYNASGTWSIVSGSGGTFMDIHDPVTIFTTNSPGAFTLRWTVKNTCNAASDEVDVSFLPVMNQPCPDVPSFSFGGQDYNTVLIGDQCWMRENLNIGTMVTTTQGMSNNGIIEKFCYQDNPSMCNTYGALYRWDEMMQYAASKGSRGICPEGWYIPTAEDWNELFTYLGSPSAAGGKLKATGTAFWGTPNTGATNESGFTAIGAGIYNYPNFDLLHLRTMFWSSNPSGTGNAWVGLNLLNTSTAQLGQTSNLRSYGLSVRCIKNNCPSLGIVNAGADQLNITGNQARLGANVPADSLNGSWTVISGSGGVFDDVNDPQSLFSGKFATSYTLQWTVSNACYQSATDQVVISFAPAFWVLQNSGITGENKEIYSFSTVDSNIVWASVRALSGNNIIPNQEYTRTTDGGINWIPGQIPMAANHAISNISAVDANHAWAALYNFSGGGRIYHTSDGGQSWTVQDSSLFQAPDGYPNFIHFFNPQQGICGGDPNGGYFEIYTTNNGGQSWTRVPQQNLPAESPGVYGLVNGFKTAGDTLWFSTNMQEVYRTTDKGLHWEKFSHTVPNGILAMKDSKEGMLIWNDQRYTLDGGKSWNPFTFNGSIWLNFNSSLLVHAKKTERYSGMYFIGSKSSTYHSSNYSYNDAADWYTLDSLYHSSFGFYNNQYGWTGACTGYPLTAGIYKFRVLCEQVVSANAGEDQVNVSGQSLTLNANVPPAGQSGSWQIVAGSGGYLFSPNAPSSIFFGLPGNFYKLVWTISNGCSFSTDTVSVNFAAPPGYCDSASITYLGQVYHTVQIGDRCWLKENLNAGSMISSSLAATNNTIIEKYCYDNLPENCQIYGGLYRWDEMMDYNPLQGSRGICPEGWHVPTEQEWCQLTFLLDNSVNCSLLNTFTGTDAGSKLKASGTNFWTAPNTGATNSSGFTALGSGIGNPDGTFTNLNILTRFWTSTSSNNNAYRISLNSGSTGVAKGLSGFDGRHAVRCIKNQCQDPTASAMADKTGILGNFCTLEAADPLPGQTGLWTILSGSGGIIENPAFPNTLFTGRFGETYTLRWTVTNTCNESDFSNVIIGFAGLQWEQQNSGITGTNKEIFTFSVADSNTVWASVRETNGNDMVPNQEFTRTLNGGDTWIPGTISNAANHAISNITAVDGNTAWAALFSFSGGGSIYHTQDGGQTWNTQGSNMFLPPDGFPNFVHFFNPLEGVCMGDPNGGYFEIYTTNDAGQTWTRVPQANIPPNDPGTFGTINEFKAVNNTIWFTTNKQEIYRSSDKGMNWVKYPTGMNFQVMAFRNGLSGLLIGDSAKRTSDGGATWSGFGFGGPLWVHWNASLVWAKETPYSTGMYIGGGKNTLNHFTSYSFNDGYDWYTLDTLFHSSYGFYNSLRGWSGACAGYPLTADIYRLGMPCPPMIQANAGNDQVIQATGPTANTTVSGNLPPAGASGFWSILSGNGGSLTQMGNSIYYTLTATAGSTITLVYTLQYDNLCASSSDTVIITFLPPPGYCSSPTITYQGQVYNTVQIGNRCWLKENLNVGSMINSGTASANDSVIQKYCYNNLPQNCQIYGGLYQWNEMMNYNPLQGSRGICPEGWHIPTEQEWCDLTVFLDYSVNCSLFNAYTGTDVGSKLKASGTTYWTAPNSGATNSSGFTALGSGIGNPDGTFTSFNTLTRFWTSTSDGSSAVRISLNSGATGVAKGLTVYDGRHAVRCIKDN